MRRAICWVLWMSLVGWAEGQQGSSNPGTVPAVVSFSGNLAGINGKPLSGIVGVTFSLYADQQGGAPLWVETQNVSPDKGGRYAVTLGSATTQGLPQAIFASGEARWLGVQPQGQAEQPRVLLMSVPYAFKAGDASTLGGLPPSAFVNTSSTGGTSTNAGSNLPPISGGGKAGFIAEWKTATQLTSSKLFQNAAGNIGLGTAKPAANLDVNGTGIVRNTLTLFPNGSAPTLTVNGTAFNVSNTGLVSFVSGQTFPGAGTITGVVAGTDLTGGGTSGNVTLNLDTTKVPQLNVANSFKGNQSVTGNLSATGIVGGGVIGASTSFNLGGNPFAFGSFNNGNAFLGFSGNSTTSNDSTWNTATGFSALSFNTTGSNNTADGARALISNTTGSYNAAEGFQALFLNTTGSYNTGVGVGAIANNTTGSSNTALGVNSGPSTNSANLTNTTAIGANAEVTANNAMVLGGINGVNGALADTLVGIGTTAPATTLHVKSSSTYEPLFVESSSGFGTWMTLNNTSSGGQNWAILSAGAGNSEGAGNLGITNFTQTSTIYLEGNVAVTGNLSKGSGSFKIDHPLDPANKYLYHSFVESPDMMNVYNGNVTTSKQGLATVVLPDYFETLNRDFRYQLTVIGQFAQAIVAKEVSGNRFIIKTNKPGVKVSWQVTGIRQDAYANAHRIQVEEDKPPQEHGRYLHPELFGAPREQAVDYYPPRAATLSAEVPGPMHQ
jgi:hypothetical protein